MPVSRGGGGQGSTTISPTTLPKPPYGPSQAGKPATIDLLSPLCCALQGSSSRPWLR